MAYCWRNTPRRAFQKQMKERRKAILGGEGQGRAGHSGRDGLVSEVVLRGGGMGLAVVWCGDEACCAERREWVDGQAA